mmetsp:Transcript_35308/g.86654  ORF Transcript_35308/g.86654 Transcript_35308/m.86654 type:complete len:223 (-) Transcript_35308:1318-1986(-)
MSSRITCTNPLLGDPGTHDCGPPAQKSPLSGYAAPVSVYSSIRKCVCTPATPPWSAGPVMVLRLGLTGAYVEFTVITLGEPNTSAPSNFKLTVTSPGAMALQLARRLPLPSGDGAATTTARSEGDTESAKRAGSDAISAARFPRTSSGVIMTGRLTVAALPGAIAALSVPSPDMRPLTVCARLTSVSNGDAETLRAATAAPSSFTLRNATSVPETPTLKITV